jgi:formamidopyrimidine-DNA glycosylase
MPELPEVETIRRALEPLVLGERITGIRLVDPTISRGDRERLQTGPIGRRINGILRRGKHLVFALEGEKGLAVHFRMTGSLLLREPHAASRVRAVLALSNGVHLYFNDMRRLGTLEFLDDVEALFRRLGAEPLSDEFTADLLRDRLSRHRIPVKAALLDQRIVAGVGNMYADEALFLARIHPMTQARDLDFSQVTSLWNTLRQVLTDAIENRGASVSTYALPNGEHGTAHHSFNVAHRRGEPCPRCGTPIERIMVRKRGAYYCPTCQPPADDTTTG